MRMNILRPVAVLLMVVIACTPRTDELGIFRPEKRAEFENELRAELGDFADKTHQIEVTEFSPDSVSVMLSYHWIDSPDGNAQDDTRLVGEAVLRVLTAKGYDPKAKMLALFVYAQEPLSSTTGTVSDRPLGKSRYHYYTNDFEWERYVPTPPRRR